MERYTFNDYVWDYKELYDEYLTEERKEEIKNSSNVKLLDITTKVFEEYRLGIKFAEKYMENRSNVKDIHQLKLVLPQSYTIANSVIILEFNAAYRALMEIRGDRQFQLEDFNTLNNGVAHEGYGEHWFKGD